MPIQDRRPKLLTISIDHCSSRSRSSSSSDGGDLRTPIPITPIPMNLKQNPITMVMTPETPTFELEVLAGIKRDRSPSAGPEELDTEWTEDEDVLLQSYLVAPFPHVAYPPGTLPPPEALDQMTTQITSRHTSRASSLETIDSDSDSIMTLHSDGSLMSEDTCGWRHSWSATRKRLFEIARLESRESVGGHRRTVEESIVPLVSSRKLVRPKLVVLGGQGMNRQQHSMDSLYGDEKQSITEAVRLSSNLQDRFSAENEGVLHHTESLSSPVTFEFGQHMSNRRAFPAFSLQATRNLPRPSLLQRGHSYTGEDLARESLIPRDDTDSEELITDEDSSSADDFAIEIDEEPTPLPPVRIATALRGTRQRPGLQRSVSGPATQLLLQVPGNTASTPTISTATVTSPLRANFTPLPSAAEPFTPLHQTTFPHSAVGMGPYLPTSHGNGDLTPRKIRRDSTPHITVESPKSSPIVDDDSATLGEALDLELELEESSKPSDPFVVSPLGDLANLHINSIETTPTPTSTQTTTLTSNGIPPTTAYASGAMTTITSLPHLSSIADGNGTNVFWNNNKKSAKPQSLSRSISDNNVWRATTSMSSFSSLSSGNNSGNTSPSPMIEGFGLPSTLSSTTSTNMRSTRSSPGRTGSNSRSPSSSSSVTESSGGDIDGPREPKRQRQNTNSSSTSTFTGSTTSHFRPRLNPGLSVSVPGHSGGLAALSTAFGGTGLGPAAAVGTGLAGGLDGSLKSPFEPRSFIRI